MALTKVGKEGVTGISNSSNATAITIDSSENVGIGTSTPAGANGIALTVNATTNPRFRLTSDNTGTGSGDGSGIFLNNSDMYISNEESAPMLFRTSATERMRIDSAGAIRLANTSMNIDNSANTATGLSVQSTGVTHIATSGNNTSLVIQRVNDTGTDNAIFFMYGSSGVGSVQVTSSSTSYNTSSDHRLKENVTATWDATTRLKQLNPVRFNFIADADTTVDGFLAHEAQTVVPEAVTGTHNEVDDDGNPVMQGIDQSKLVPLLTKALIESVAKIEELEARITALETE